MGAGDLDPCELLEWDTAFWGFQVARVLGDSLTGEQLMRIDAWCGQNGIRCLYFLSRLDDPATTQLAEDNGFRLVDIRVTFACEPLGSITAAGSLAPSSALLRESKPEDLPSLQRIARRLYHDTRFYHDANFPRHMCDLFYETWIKRSCEGWADVVLVAEVDGEAIGYTSCHLGDRPGTGRIGLVGVGDRTQGRRVGQALIVRALEWFSAQGAQEVTVVTQGRNCSAQRLYQRCGFLTREMQAWYHKWYSPQGSDDDPSPGPYRRQDRP